MKIVPIQESPPVIILEFDPVEVEHSLFQTAKAEAVKPVGIELMTESIKETKDTLPTDFEDLKDQIDTIDKPLVSTITITGEAVKGEHPTVTLGKLVDNIREKFTGDVLPVIDEKTGEDIKDYKKIPQYQIGKLETVERYEKAVAEVEAEKQEEASKPVDEKPVEDPIKEEEPIEDINIKVIK